jgi:hypothetical protein
MISTVCVKPRKIIRVGVEELGYDADHHRVIREHEVVARASSQGLFIQEVTVSVSYHQLVPPVKQIPTHVIVIHIGNHRVVQMVIQIGVQQIPGHPHRAVLYGHIRTSSI